MTESFLSIIDRFKEADSTEREKLMEKIKDFALKNEHGSPAGVTYRLLRRVAVSNPNYRITEILESEYSNLRVKYYIDDDDKAKIAIGIAFIEDFPIHEENIDKKILYAIHDFLVAEGLSSLFNDISVNNYQLRNNVLQKY